MGCMGQVGKVMSAARTRRKSSSDDADEDDQSLFKLAIANLGVPHPVLVFADGQTALDYLTTSETLPFLIISEISLPGMSGLELREHLEEDEQIRKKSIPFIFMTYPVEEHLVEQAYEMTIQGLFEKRPGFLDWQSQLKDIIAYWTDCYHPKRFAK